MSYAVSEELKIIRFVNHPQWLLARHHRLEAVTIMKVEHVTGMLLTGGAPPLMPNINSCFTSLCRLRRSLLGAQLCRAARIDQVKALLRDR